MKRVILALCLVMASSAAMARPVSYADGWMAMTMNDKDSNAAQILYSPTAFTAYGINQEYMRGPDANLTALQVNFLLKRWNMPDSQANFYLLTGAGAAYGSGETAAAGYAGIEADWENRRYFVQYQNRFMDAGDIERYARQTARIGVAPYIGDYGDVHTWLMLQADYEPAADDNDDFSLTPLIRLFKGSNLGEIGYNTDGGILFNYTHTF